MCMQLVENVKWKYILLLESILVWCVPPTCLRLIASFVMSVGVGTHPLDIPTSSSYPPPPQGPVTRDTYGRCRQKDM